MSRALATFRIVSELIPIDGADKVEVAMVDSWRVVVRKGEVEVGSLVVYFEVDSWIPAKLAPHLCRTPPRMFEEIEGELLKTRRIRGEISQGLVMNIADVIKSIPEFAEVEPVEETDVTEILGIKKWEPPLTYGVGTFKARGNYPSFIPKTEQERIQNLTKRFDTFMSHRWEVTEKFDGASVTVYSCERGEGVCSRNIDLEVETSKGISVYWKVALRDHLLDKIRGHNLALQGELVGDAPNRYKLSRLDFWLFDVYDIDARRHYSPIERREFSKLHGINHVPVLFEDYEITGTIPELLALAEGKSRLDPKVEREGLVFKRSDGRVSFKVISNNYLMITG